MPLLSLQEFPAPNGVFRCSARYHIAPCLRLLQPARRPPRPPAKPSPRRQPFASPVGPLPALTPRPRAAYSRISRPGPHHVAPETWLPWPSIGSHPSACRSTAGHKYQSPQGTALCDIPTSAEAIQHVNGGFKDGLQGGSWSCFKTRPPCSRASSVLQEH
ncbi:hypothetical protein NDU88_006452 [Pleurodeles waltl]|uniref:Uncharacterized protein n=1 Tax=Pleurodeles waltl TaxID=8319 RepID=A0AAV7UL23_PLEWA|nr:hypothetical protein NDU88_006452 [Pleurodeles waltl]